MGNIHSSLANQIALSNSVKIQILNISNISIKRFLKTCSIRKKLIDIK